MILKNTNKVTNFKCKFIKNTRISDKKKSFALSIIMATSLAIVLFFIRFWPPLHINELVENGGGGVTVNFGNTDRGFGTNVQSKKLQKTTTSKTTNEISQATKNVLTSVNSVEEAVPISKKKNIKKVVEQALIKVTTKTETKKPIVQKTDDALANLLRNNSKGGDGQSRSSGNQGQPNGSISSTAYSGGTGSGLQNGTGSGNSLGAGNGGGAGNGSGYLLGNRKAISKPTPNYNCNEQGSVVVEITVDQNGLVIAAKPGVKGSTNTANCLLSQAKIAALNTKWEASSSAPDLQIGKIVYNFSLN